MFSDCEKINIKDYNRLSTNNVNRNDRDGLKLVRNLRILSTTCLASLSVPVTLMAETTSRVIVGLAMASLTISQGVNLVKAQKTLKK